MALSGCGSAARPAGGVQVTFTVPPLLSVQPTWTTCRFQTVTPQQLSHCVRTEVITWSVSSTQTQTPHSRQFSWNLKCGRNSPERSNFHTEIDSCVFFFLFLFIGVISLDFIKMSVLWTNYLFFLACCCGLGFGNPNRCDEVRKVFQLRQIGPNQLLPLSPRPGMYEFSLHTPL